MTSGQERPGETASQQVGRRIRQYELRARVILWTGAGLASVVGLFAAMEFSRDSDLPRGVVAVIPILVVLGGACFAVARIQFEWASEVLKREIEDGLQPSATLPEEYRDWPSAGEAAYKLQLLLTGVAGSWIIVMAIWSAVAGEADANLQDPATQPTADATAAPTSTPVISQTLPTSASPALSITAPSTPPK